MTAYIIRRLLLIIPTLWAIITINFFIMQIAPGGPVEQMIARMMDTDSGVMESVQKYQHVLDETQVQLAIMDGLSHEQVFEEIDMVFDMMVAFSLL